MASKREREIAESISSAVDYGQIREALEAVGELRRQGLVERPAYRITSPHGSGIQELMARQVEVESTP